MGTQGEVAETVRIAVQGERLMLAPQSRMQGLGSVPAAEEPEKAFRAVHVSVQWAYQETTIS